VADPKVFIADRLFALSMLPVLPVSMVANKGAITGVIS
jgi:hypothetical protein